MMRSSQSELVDRKSQKEQPILAKVEYKSSLPLKNLTCIHIFGDTLYLGTRASKLYILKIEGTSFKQQKVIIPHCEIVSSITANHNYFITVAESDDEMPVSVWDAQSKMFLTALKSHESQVSKVIFLSEPGWLATSSWDCTVKIWDLNNILDWENKTRTLQSEYPVLTVQQISKDIIAFGGDDCYINFWNWRSSEFLGKFFGHAGSVTFIHAQLPFILTAGGDHKFKQWQYVPSHDLARKSSVLQIVQNIKEGNQTVSISKIIRMSRQIKKNYDSSLFVVKLSQNSIFLLDRHGSRFVHNFGGDLMPYPNDFHYNENITGMVYHEGRLYATTTKGELKCYQLLLKNKPLQQN